MIKYDDKPETISKAADIAQWYAERHLLGIGGVKPQLKIFLKFGILTPKSLKRK